MTLLSQGSNSRLLMCYQLTSLCSSLKPSAQLLSCGSWSTAQGLAVCCQAGCLSKLPSAHWSTVIKKQRTSGMWFGSLKPVTHLHQEHSWTKLHRLLSVSSLRGAGQTASRFRCPEPHQLQSYLTTTIYWGATFWAPTHEATWERWYKCSSTPL